MGHLGFLCSGASWGLSACPKAALVQHFTEYFEGQVPISKDGEGGHWWKGQKQGSRQVLSGVQKWPS